MGQAVGFARDCKADLKAIQHSSLSKAHIRKSAIAARAAREEETVTELLSKYTMINDTVKFSLRKKDLPFIFLPNDLTLCIHRSHMNSYRQDKNFKR